MNSEGSVLRPGISGLVYRQGINKVLFLMFVTKVKFCQASVKCLLSLCACGLDDFEVYCFYYMLS